MNGTDAQKEKTYRITATTGNLFGHWYVGFEGAKCSHMFSDHKEQVLKECAWVWGKREKKWIKRP